MCRHKKNDADAIKGMPMHGQESLVARRLFNVCSELDENLRSHAFALLVLAQSIEDAPGRDVGGDDMPSGDKEIDVGTNNAITLNEMATQQHYYLGPPANIADSLEKRIAELIREIYRMARTEHVRPAGVADATGIARRYAFAATNAAVAAFAQLVALWEQEVYVLVGLALGIPQAKLDKIRVVAPTEFDIEDLASAIKETASALAMDLGASAKKALKSRLLQTLLPNADKALKAKIEEELEEMAVEDDADDAFDDPNAGGAPLPIDPNAPLGEKPQPTKMPTK